MANTILIPENLITNAEAEKYPAGQLFRVPWDTENRYYMRTDLAEYPFIDLSTGEVTCAGGAFNLIPLGNRTISIT